MWNWDIICCDVSESLGLPLSLVDATFLHSVAAFRGCVPNGLVTTISTTAEINFTLKAIKCKVSTFFDWDLQFKRTI